MSLFTETVEVGVRTAGDRDDYGNPVVTTEWVSTPAWVESQSAIELDDRQERTDADIRIYLPASVDAEHTSAIRWGGHEWEVQGEPARQPGGFAVRSFQMLIATRTEG